MLSQCCYLYVSRERWCEGGDCRLSQWDTARIYASRTTERVGQESRFVHVIKILREENCLLYVLAVSYNSVSRIFWIWSLSWNEQICTENLAKWKTKIVHPVEIVTWRSGIPVDLSYLTSILFTIRVHRQCCVPQGVVILPLGALKLSLSPVKQILISYLVNTSFLYTYVVLTESSNWKYPVKSLEFWGF